MLYIPRFEFDIENTDSKLMLNMRELPLSTNQVLTVFETKIQCEKEQMVKTLQINKT